MTTNTHKNTTNNEIEKKKRKPKSLTTKQQKLFNPQPATKYNKT